MELINHIIIRDNIAYIAGHDSLKAEMVARMVVDGEYSIEATMEHYQLTHAEVHSALAYYYDHKIALDEIYHEKLARIRASATTLDAFKQSVGRKKS